MVVAKETSTREALEQTQKDIASLLVPYVTKLMEDARIYYDPDPSIPLYEGNLRTLFLHQTRNITPDADIFKLDLSVTPRKLRRPSVELTVLERAESGGRNNPSTLRFTLSGDGTLHFRKLKSETRETDPLSFLEDVKKGLEALPTVSYGRI